MSPSKDKYLLKCCLIHQKRCFIEQKISELGLEPNFDEQYNLISNRYHMEFLEYSIGEDNKIHGHWHHYIKSQIDEKHFTFSNKSIFEIKKENGLYIHIE